MRGMFILTWDQQMSPVVISCALWWVHWNMAPGVQEFSSKSSSTEETNNHLTVNKTTFNIFLLKGKQRKPKRMICGCRIFVGFFSSFLTMCLLLVNAARSHKWNRRRKHRGMRCEQNSLEGVDKTGRRAQIWAVLLPGLEWIWGFTSSACLLCHK